MESARRAQRNARNRERYANMTEEQKIAQRHRCRLYYRRRQQVLPSASLPTTNLPAVPASSQRSAEFARQAIRYSTRANNNDEEQRSSERECRRSSYRQQQQPSEHQGSSARQIDGVSLNSTIPTIATGQTIVANIPESSRRSAELEHRRLREKTRTDSMNEEHRAVERERRRVPHRLHPNLQPPELENIPGTRVHRTHNEAARPSCSTSTHTPAIINTTGDVQEARVNNLLNAHLRAELHRMDVFTPTMVVDVNRGSVSIDNVNDRQDEDTYIRAHPQPAQDEVDIDLDQDDMSPIHEQGGPPTFQVRRQGIVRARRRTAARRNCARNFIDYNNLQQLQFASVVECPFCCARLFPYETNQLCCMNGNVRLPLVEAPAELRLLLSEQSERGFHFRQNMKAYNHILAFTSMGVHIDRNLASGQQGVYTYRAQGAIYHRIGCLLPQVGARPRYLQMYIYDTEHEVQNRLTESASLNAEVIATLTHMLDNYNPFVRVFRQLAQRPDLQDLRLQIREQPNLRPQYNLPNSSEVAAVLVGEDDEEANERDFIVSTNSGHLLNVPDTAGFYDPLQYPLLYPCGNFGWDLHISNDSAQRISCRAFYAYQIQSRTNHDSILLRSGRLFQQYVVDNYVKIATQQLRYIRDQQDVIRADLYQGLRDSLNAGQTSSGDVGRRIILPASYTGSPRDMHRRYNDAMALVLRFGKPDLFVTMTCNPKWEEITNCLHHGQLATDRPDITTRVFRAKLEALKLDLFSKGVFGKVIAHVHVVEFQKRGLPHAHILLILHPGDKLNTPDDYDRVVRAEIPSPEIEPELFNIVLSHMIHGPCGDLNRDCVCMKNGACKKSFPKQFAPATLQGSDSYPIYRRRDNGESIALNDRIFVDNRWVVPYNPWLLKKYNCHLNVEVCSTIKAVKYLYKYVYKGSDRVSLEVSDTEQDEIRQFVDARWVCPQQACWRIFQFRLNAIYPSVCALQIHLPNMQEVTFYEGRNLQQVVEDERNSRTMLTEFFRTNREDQQARQLLYRDFPEKYKWNKSQRHWERRQQVRGAIGRVHSVYPSEGERYYLRILLNHVRGCTSFDDLLTVNSTRYGLFKQAATQLGLLEKDEAARETLFEASGTHMPSSFRRLFTTLLVFCDPVGVRDLWNEFYSFMIEDYPSSNSAIVSTDLLLHDLNTCLSQYQLSTADYDLPSPTNNIDLRALSNIILEELSISTPSEDFTFVEMLNDDQMDAFHRIIQSVESNESAVYFIDGPGGTGKTFLYKAILAYLRGNGSIAIATATSGIAATMMAGDRTAHSRFKLPFNPTPTSTCQISKQSTLARLLRQASLIIWDEATMTHRYAFEALDRTLKDIMDNDLPFGGKIFVLGGDFRQVLPIVVRGTRSQTINACLTNSPLWQYVNIIHLQQNMRARTDASFAEYLLRIGDGNEQSFLDDMIKVPDEINLEWKDDHSLVNLLDFVFPALCLHADDKVYMTNRAIITPTNESVDFLNEKVIQMYPGEEKVYFSYDSVENDSRNLYQPEFLNSITAGGLPPHKLTLKKGAPIILLRNTDPRHGLCNGTRLICKNFYEHIIDAEIITGSFSGTRVFLHRIPMKPSESLHLPFKITRKQFPIRLSFALTINRSQGQTIPQVGIYLPDHVFSHGQLYVALSRGTSTSTTKIMVKKGCLNDFTGTFTRNVVYKEVLESCI